MASSSRTSLIASSFNPPKLKDFVLTDKLGSGTYATVYKANKKSDQNGDHLAIKCIEKSSLNRTSIENLLVEIEILKQIKHEHVVQLYDFQWDESYIYLIMEYCGGGDLSTLIQRQQKIPEFTVRRFLQQIASALQLLHENNISHLDLKPQNILLTSEQHPVLKLADFGFAQYVEKNQDFKIRGSPLYMAPEMILHHHYDAKVDLWSVGVILYEALFGKAPFASRTFDELENKIKSDHPIEIPSNPTVSTQCRHLLSRLLQRNPQERISFEEFFNDPFVDLEHKPSKDCLEKATLIVTKAVTQDKNGKVADAAKLYSQAIEYFVPAIYYERDRRKKEALRRKVEEYCARAEQLKQSMKPVSNQSDANSLQQLIDLSRDKPILLHGLQLLSTARSKEKSERFKEAKILYEESLSDLIPALAKEDNLQRKNLLHSLVEDSLRRAESIKDYLAVNQLKEATSKSLNDDAETDSHPKCIVQ